MEELLLKKYFSLNPPASIDVISEVKRKISIKLPKTYEDFLLICNGLYSRETLPCMKYRICQKEIMIMRSGSICLTIS